MKRLYYTESFLDGFSARVVRCEPDADRARVVLDQTAFYPTSGGQPHDLGTLGDAVVLDVIDEGDEIVHVLDRPLEVGADVEGLIDWPRRFDHMQQHTGQHILSAAFEQTCGVRTESFHLGTTTCTIDLAREVTPADIAAAERAACDVVFADRAVTVRFVSEQEAAALPLRKESLRTGTLRLVEIDRTDLSACGGTHVTRTGMVGLIAVSGWERFKGASRITFVCGRRALDSHERLRDTVTGLIRQLTVAPNELGAAVERLQQEGRTMQKSIKALQQDLARHISATLVAQAEPVGRFRRVLVEQPGWDAAALKVLASALVTHPGIVAVVTGDGTPAPLVVARSADVVFDAGAWLKSAAAALGGRGGGRPELAQGAAGTANQVLEHARLTVIG
jgi:alanyl-tRNA synthetase